jgi:dipeptidyl aminopeptidase/acylaminoacyl peptidase
MYQAYPSSVQEELTLYADFQVPAESRPLLVTTHGWHGQIKQAHADNVDSGMAAKDWFVVAVEMRGRGDSGGKPDCNGWELQDVVDAVEFAKREFAGKIREPRLVTLTGCSGGGANVMSLLGKFPDYFCRARAECGISDFALWYQNDRVGEFRDEMDIWMGATPDQDPEAYASRSGRVSAGNLCTPLIIFHGDKDPRCPVEQARLYVDAARRAGKGEWVSYFELKGVGHPGHYGGSTPAQEEFRLTAGEAFLKDRPALVSIPEKGYLVVGGYLKTHDFEVVLENINRVGEIHYDLNTSSFALHALKPCKARLRVRQPDDRWEERELTSC